MYIYIKSEQLIWSYFDVSFSFSFSFCSNINLLTYTQYHPFPRCMELSSIIFIFHNRFYEEYDDIQSLIITHTYIHILPLDSPISTRGKLPSSDCKDSLHFFSLKVLVNKSLHLNYRHRRTSYKLYTLWHVPD